MFTEKKKEEFIIIHDELDAIIDKIVMAKAEYGEYQFKYGSHTWSYDGGLFEIEAEEDVGGYCCDSPETYWLQVSWEDIFNEKNIVENLKKESEERKIMAKAIKLLDETNAQKEKLAKERVIYNRLKAKFEKS
jgi:hypothetical protein